MPLLRARRHGGEQQNSRSWRGRDMAPFSATAATATSSNLNTLIAGCRDELLAFADRTLATTAGAHEVDAADALQQGLLRFFREYGDGFSADAAEARNHLYNAVKFGARDAIRQWHHRGAVRTLPADLAAVDELVEDGDNDERVVDPTLMLAATAVRDQSEAFDQAEAIVDAQVLQLALAALDPLEQQVLLRQPASRNELAAELGVTPEKVRDALFSARKLARTLIEHASGDPLPDAEREQLFGLLDGR